VENAYYLSPPGAWLLCFEHVASKTRPDDDASKTKFSTPPRGAPQRMTQPQGSHTNRRANITESDETTNEVHFIDEVCDDPQGQQEDAGSGGLAASVHQTSNPDERTDLIINASAGREPLPPGNVMSLLSDGTDRRGRIRTPGASHSAPLQGSCQGPHRWCG